MLRRLKIMPRSTAIFLFILTILAVLLGYNYFARPFYYQKGASVEVSQTPSQAAEPSATPSPVDDLSIKEQVTQLLAMPYSVSTSEAADEVTPAATSAITSAATRAATLTTGETPTSAATPTPAVSPAVSEPLLSPQLSWLENNQPGLITLFGESISSASASTDIELIKSKFKADNLPLIAVDHEGGRVQRLSGTGFTQLPSWKKMCGLEENNRHKLLTASAQELAQVGVNVVFAPVVDIASSSGVLKQRVCSPDPEITQKRALEMVDIFKQHGILPVIKHFPGIGNAKVDLHQAYAEVEVSESQVFIFKELLDAYPQLGVMVSHVGVKDLYEGTPCSLNPACVKDLSGHFQEALIFSDALEMKSASYQADAKAELPLAARAVKAVTAGNNVLVFGPEVSPADLDEVVSALVDAYEANEDFAQQVRQSVEKIMAYKTALSGS